MAVRDVTQLRREGKLDEALKMALTDLRNDPNEWSRMAMFWVLRDMVQNVCIPNKDIEQAKAYLSQMKALLPGMKDDNEAGKNAYCRLLKSLSPDSDTIQNACELSKTDPVNAYNLIRGKFGPKYSGVDASLHEDIGWIIYRYLKANVNDLSSLEVRGLFRDYIVLENPRPSMLHSAILRLAINYAKDHSDFNFYKFFLLWGVGNLRAEDWQKGVVDGHEIPSLIERICRTIIESGEQFGVRNFVQQFGRKEIVVLDFMRQDYFWKLVNLHKEGKLQDLWSGFDDYASTCSILGPSYWHSEVLKIAYRFMSEKESYRFLAFMVKWYDKGNFSSDDWKKEVSTEGVEYPSLAAKSAKRCFDVIKQEPRNRDDSDLMHWIKALYAEVMKHDAEDDWAARNYATICIWEGSIDEAVNTYRKLLLHKSRIYYLWAELAGCTSDPAIRIGLLLKAKRLERNEDFLGDIHLALAKAWLQEGVKDMASDELEAYIKHYNSKGWAISSNYNKLVKDIQTLDGRPLQKDVNIEEYVRRAEDYAYPASEMRNFVLTERTVNNAGIEYCSFYDGEDLSFSVKSKQFKSLKNCNPGTIVQTRYYIVKDNAGQSMHAMFVRPLTIRKTNLSSWSILPFKYGVIDYVNEQKHVLHILTQDSRLVFYTTQDLRFKTDCFVKFREYMKRHKDQTRTHIVNIFTCPAEEALPNMQSRIVVVDEVQDDLQKFHIIMKDSIPQGFNIRYDQTSVRPSVGDTFNLTFCMKQNKAGKRLLKVLYMQKIQQQNNILSDNAIPV